MDYLDVLLRSPRFWTFSAALFAGGGLSRLVMLVFAGDRREHLQRRRLTVFMLLLAFAIVAYTLGIFLPPAYGILAARVLLFGAGALGASLLFFSLFRYFFAPLVVMVIVGTVAGIYVNVPWMPVYSETELATARVIGLEGERFSIEVTLAASKDGRTWLVDGTGNSLAASVEIVRYHPAYFFLGRRTAARLVGLEAYREEAVEDEARWMSAASYRVEERFQRVTPRLRQPARLLLEWLPGITIESRESSPRTLQVLEEYRAAVLPDGSFRFASGRM